MGGMVQNLLQNLVGHAGYGDGDGDEDGDADEEDEGYGGYPNMPPPHIMMAMMQEAGMIVPDNEEDAYEEKEEEEECEEEDSNCEEEDDDDMPDLEFPPSAEQGQWSLVDSAGNKITFDDTDSSTPGNSDDFALMLLETPDDSNWETVSNQDEIDELAASAEQQCVIEEVE